MDFDKMKADAERRMGGAIDVLKTEFGGLRTGRATTSLLEPLKVQAYEQSVPINQVGTIAVPEPRLITVQVWDKDLVSSVEKSIRDSDLGLNPSSDGQTVRVPVPPLSEERRIELKKIASRYAEDTKVAVRNIRRHIMDDLKRSEKESEISKDRHKEYEGEIQELTDQFVRRIDESLEKKDNEILQV